MMADHREQRIALGNLVAENLDEVRAKRNAINVHEQQIGAKFMGQAVVDPAGMTRAVVASVADENLGRHDRSRRDFEAHNTRESPVV